MPPERIYVIGGPGSGKTTLAGRLGALTGITVQHLDEVARVGGGRGPERSDGERAAAVAAILRAERWLVEGVHLGWTRPLLEAADVVVWLDHVRWQRSSAMIVRRFLGQAVAEARRRRGRERFLRFGDYARRLRELAVSVPESRTFPRAELEQELSRLGATVIHCRTPADVEAVVSRLGKGGAAGSLPDRGQIAPDH